MQLLDNKVQEIAGPPAPTPAPDDAPPATAAGPIPAPAPERPTYAQVAAAPAPQPRSPLNEFNHIRGDNLTWDLPSHEFISDPEQSPPTSAFKKLVTTNPRAMVNGQPYRVFEGATTALFLDVVCADARPPNHPQPIPKDRIVHPKLESFLILLVPYAPQLCTYRARAAIDHNLDPVNAETLPDTSVALSHYVREGGQLFGNTL
jgi:hypothetical protein